jgi:outer membrane protein TolC
MVRNICSVVLVLLVCVGGTARAAAPPSSGPQVRFLSLAKAVRLALEHQVKDSGDSLDREQKEAAVLLNVEFAYWNLYGSYWTLYSREQALRWAYELFKITRARYEAGRSTAADFVEARGQYELFRNKRLEARDVVLHNEQELRALMGMSAKDGSRLVPGDSPSTERCKPKWDDALREALANRPEVIRARKELKAAQLNLLLTKNLEMPDLRKLFKPLSSMNNKIPVANPVREAKLDLVRRMETLKDAELKAQGYLARYFRQISLSHETILAQKAQREAFEQQLRARKDEFAAGRGTLDVLLEAQRFWADAVANEHQAMAQYSKARAGFAFARGGSLDYFIQRWLDGSPTGGDESLSSLKADW